MAQKIQLEVKKKEQVTEKTFFVTFRCIDPSKIEFRAGQNMMLMIAPGVNRTMSIASPPQQKHELLMVHDVSPMGPGSKWTMGLAVGDRVTIIAPTGGMLSLTESTRRKVLVATGTGIAPYHAMVLDYIARHQKPETRSPIALYWGVRHEHDVYWKEEFDRIADAHEFFSWQLVLSKPGNTWKGNVGHVTEYVLHGESPYTDREFYLCGNKAMIDELHTALIDCAVPKEHIKTELFYK